MQYTNEGIGLSDRLSAVQSFVIDSVLESVRPFVVYSSHKIKYFQDSSPRKSEMLQLYESD